MTKLSILGMNFALRRAIPDALTRVSRKQGKENKSQEQQPRMDLVYVLAIIGFFGLCIGYAYAFDRI